MTAINHEAYVSLEVAKLLKEAGFDWKCVNRYIKDTDVLVPCPGEANWNAVEWGINDYKSAPTFAVAQKWLREVKHTDLYVWCHSYGGVVTAYDYSSYHSLRVDDGGVIIKQGDKAYDTYEEALEAGIKKALEMILEKGE